MGNRSKYVAAAGFAAGALGARRLVRRRRLGRAARGFAETVMPGLAADGPTTAPLVVDEAHAPGHRHLFVDTRTPRPGGHKPG